MLHSNSNLYKSLKAIAIKDSLNAPVIFVQTTLPKLDSKFLGIFPEIISRKASEIGYF